jgi:hypothetical protein
MMLENNPSSIQIEIMTFLAQFVRDRMMRVPNPGCGDISYQVFDHEFVSAYQWTAEILSDLGLMKPVDEECRHLFVFVCEPKNFHDTIRSNAEHIPNEQNCFECLVSFSEQSCEIRRDPVFSFLEGLGIVEMVETAEALDIQPIVEAVMTAMGIENNETNRKRISADMQSYEARQPPEMDYEFTEKGKRLKEIMYLKNEGRWTDEEKRRLEF